MTQTLRLTFALTLLATRLAAASSYCVIVGIDKNGFQKRCSETSYRAAIGNSIPSFGDSFKLNPSALPVMPSPMGVEIIASSKGYSYATGSDLQISLIKGFKDLGVGLSSDPGNTFYSSRTPTSTTSGANLSGLSLNVGTLNLGMATLLNAAKSGSLTPIIGGGALLIDPVTQAKGYSGGLSLSSKALSAGVSYSKDPNDLIPSWNISLSLAKGPLDVDFIYRMIGADFLTSSPLERVYFGNLSLRMGPFTLCSGYKNHTYVGTSYSEKQILLAAQLAIGQSMRLSYLLNYRYAAQSLGLQVLFF